MPVNKFNAKSQRREDTKERNAASSCVAIHAGKGTEGSSSGNKVREGSMRENSTAATSTMQAMTTSGTL